MEYDSPYIKEEQKKAIQTAIQNGRKLSIITYVLGDKGESKLKYIIYSILKHYGREDLMELIYTSAKELIANSTKAAIKRMIFQEMNLNIMNLNDYNVGMEKFKEYLNDKKFPAYKEKMKKNNFFIKITLAHCKDYIRLYVINNFFLIPVEEERVIEKFQHAKKFDNLFEFFMAHGDTTEGAGMGITMVEILLTQSGYDRNNFKILSSPTANITIARVDIPLNDAKLVMDNQPGEQLIRCKDPLEIIKGAF